MLTSALLLSFAISFLPPLVGYKQSGELLEEHFSFTGNITIPVFIAYLGVFSLINAENPCLLVCEEAQLKSLSF